MDDLNGDWIALGFVFVAAHRTSTSTSINVLL